MFAATLLALACSACGSSGSESGSAADAPSTSSDPGRSSGPTDPTSQTSSSQQTDQSLSDAQFHARAQTGDQASFVLDAYTPVVASSLPADVQSICASQLSTFGYSMDRALAVRVRALGSVTTALPTTIGVALGAAFVLDSGGNINVLPPPAWWALPFSDGPQCEDAASSNEAVTWQGATTNDQREFDFYIIVPNAITPNDPTGASSAAHFLAFTPLFTVNLPTAASRPVAGLLAHCKGTEGTHVLPWVFPSDVQGARAAGCRLTPVQR